MAKKGNRQKDLVKMFDLASELYCYLDEPPFKEIGELKNQIEVLLNRIEKDPDYQDHVNAVMDE